MNLLEQYRSGNFFSVWHELKFGPDLRDDDLIIQATEIARLFSETAFSNFSRIKSTLDELGYEFLDPENALKPAASTAIQEIDEFEDKHGRLPIVIRSWYSVFDSIDFSQAETQGRGEGQHSSSPVKGLGFNCDLIFRPLRECSQLIKPSFRNERKKFLPFGSYCTNCDPKGVDFPSNRFEAVYYNEGAGDVGFGDDIRFVFSSCGFKFWKTIRDFNYNLDESFVAIPDYDYFYSLAKPQIKPL